MPNWGEVLLEINNLKVFHAAASQQAVDIVRREYLKKLHERTGRNVIAYYSGFLSKPDVPSEINDEDKNGFMMAVHKLDRNLGLDLILHTPVAVLRRYSHLLTIFTKCFRTTFGPLFLRLPCQLAPCWRARARAF